MELVKDLGMKENASGNRYRAGIYKCPSCESEVELYVHNVKNQLKRSEKSGKHPTCLKCTLITRNTTHSKSRTPAYQKWNAMKSRCTNPNYPNYKRWGGRGIIVCEEWLNSFEVFEEWFLSQYFEKGYELDRIDNDGNYCPENCRLVPKYENARNKENPAKKHSKYRYVNWNKDKGRWHVSVPVPNKKGKRKYLGLFHCEEKAQESITKYLNSFDNDLNGLLDSDEKEEYEKVNNSEIQCLKAEVDRLSRLEFPDSTGK